MSQSERESETIKRLREQVHRSFLQISQMEKLFHMEMEHTKEQFEEREKALKQREEDIRQKYAQVETNMRIKESFVVDVADFFDSSLDEIIYRKEDTMRDSGIEKIKELLIEEEKRANNDFEAQLGKLRELQKSISKSIQSPPGALFQLFQISNELCLDNCRLREELLNYQQATEVYKVQILEGERIVQKLKISERRLQKQNQQLNELYVQEASMNAEVEEQIKVARQDLVQKNNEFAQLRQQMTKLTDTFKTGNRIDMSKLNLKGPSTNKSKTDDDNLNAPVLKDRPNPMRMSSGAILLRNTKPNTPQSQNTNETEISPKPRLTTFDYGPKFLKKKFQQKKFQQKKNE